MSGAIAVVFAPGPVLRRQGATVDQNRACTNCNDPENYLDVRSSPSPSEDNKDFADNTTNDGFIEGPLIDVQGNLIINDKLAVITYEGLMPLLEKRIVGEVLKCLKAYSEELATLPNPNRYPWAAALSVSGPTYDDSTNTRFGRVPDGFPDPAPGNPNVAWNTTVTPPEQFTNTQTDGTLMAKSWPLEKCLIVSKESKNTWWLNWKESVFYGVADAYKPDSSLASPTACSGAPGACLTVTPTATAHTFVVIAAGRSLVGQTRTTDLQKGQITNYLEAQNTTVPPTDETFTSGPVTAVFNDVVCKQGIC